MFFGKIVCVEGIACHYGVEDILFDHLFSYHGFLFCGSVENELACEWDSAFHLSMVKIKYILESRLLFQRYIPVYRFAGPF